MTVLMASYPISWGISSIISVTYLIIFLRLKTKKNTDKPKGKKMIYLCLILCIIAVLSILYGITVMLANSGSKFFLCWIAGGLFLIMVSFLYYKGLLQQMPKAAKIIFSVIIALGILYVVITQCMVFSGFKKTTAKNLDYIIVLGSQVKPSGPALVTRYRLDEAYRYAAENPETIIIVSGGQGSNEPASEASVMRDYLIAKGIDESRILMEDKSTNTSENLQFCSTLYPELTDSSVGIVSSNFHIFRALAIARKSGYSDIYGIPAHSVILYLPNNCIRESVGILKDFLMGNL